MPTIDFHGYSDMYEASIWAVMGQLGWNPRYVAAQLWGIKALAESTEGDVILAQVDGKVVAYIEAQHHPWNRLSQVQGVAVAPAYRRLGLARQLMQKIEAKAQQRMQRGIYEDTPVENQAGRGLFKAQGYNEAYTMPQYYGPGSDGVTYLKLFGQA